MNVDGYIVDGGLKERCSVMESSGKRESEEIRMKVMMRVISHPPPVSRGRF